MIYIIKTKLQFYIIYIIEMVHIPILWIRILNQCSLVWRVLMVLSTLWSNYSYIILKIAMHLLTLVLDFCLI